MPTITRRNSDSTTQLSDEAAGSGDNESLSEAQCGDEDDIEEVEEEEEEEEEGGDEDEVEEVDEEVEEEEGGNEDEVEEVVEEEDGDEEGGEEDAVEEVVEEEEERDEEDGEEDAVEVVVEEEEEGDEEDGEEDEVEEENEEEEEVKGGEGDGEEDEAEEIMEDRENGEEKGVKGREEDPKEDEVMEEVAEDVNLPNKDAMDTGVKIESEELGGCLESISLPHGRSNSSPMTVAHETDGNGGNLIAFNPSDSEAQMGKGTPKEVVRDAKEAHEGEAHLSLGDSSVGENTRSDHENDITLGSKNVSPGDVEKEAQPFPRMTDLPIPEDSCLSSMRAPCVRPRSPSPGANVENANKRSAVICDFFARGWCIKGTKCRFLHHKEEVVNPNLRERGDIAGASGKEDSVDGRGVMEGANADSVLRSPSNSQRALLRAYGEENHGQANADSSLRSPSNSQRVLLRDYGEGNHGLLKSYLDQDTHEANPQSCRKSYPSMNEFRHTPVQEMHSGDSLYDSPFKRGSPLARSTVVPEYRYNGSSTASTLYQNNNNSLAYHVPPTGSYTSYSSLNSGFSNPFPSVRNSPSIYDRGNYGSRSASLPRSSSPFYPRSEAESIVQYNVPRDIPAFAGHRSQVNDAWAPSITFRSSFGNAPRSQYDPLVDSIEHNTANITFQSSERTITHTISSQHINGDSILSGSHTPQNLLNSFPQAHEGNSSLPKEDDGALLVEEDACENPMNIEDKGRNNKESKALRFFRSALVDYVKELVKPSWREGHLSKDAHKMVVKKAVEKVLSAIQLHQVPSTAESIDQYLSTSRPKLLRLVEGYVDKYKQSGAS